MQINAAAVADGRVKMAAGMEIPSVEIKLPRAEKLCAGISELEDLSVGLVEWLSDDPDRLLQLFPEIATTQH
jgi:hypothetical protein